MITPDTTLYQLGEILVSHNASIRKIELFFRGWLVELGSDRGIFEVRDQPTMYEALAACLQKVIETPKREVPLKLMNRPIIVPPVIPTRTDPTVTSAKPVH